MPGDISLMRGSVPTESAIASNWSLLRKTFPPILGDQDTSVAVHEMTLRTRKIVSNELDAHQKGWKDVPPHISIDGSADDVIVVMNSSVTNDHKCVSVQDVTTPHIEDCANAASMPKC